MQLTRSALSAARLPWVSLFVTLTAVLLQYHPQLAGWLALVPARLGEGEAWRLWTGHLTHFNRAHAVGDIGAFCVWAAAVELRDRRLLLWSLLGAGLLVSGLILLAYPALDEYRGLSAIDCALAAMLMAMGLGDPRLRRRPALLGGFALCALGLLAKTVFEFVRGHAILAPDLGHDVGLLPGAHAFGIASGLAVFAVWRVSSGRRIAGSLALSPHG